MNTQVPPAMPLFDTLQHFESSNPYINQYLASLVCDGIEDASLTYEHALDFLVEQRHNENNYKSHRSELTGFLHWCWREEGVSLANVDRRLLVRYLDYCQAPPVTLIGYRNVAQFTRLKGEDTRRPNPQWRPFLGKRSLGKVLPYRLSVSAIKTKLALLSAFFTYLNDVEYTDRNPAALLLKRAKARYAGNAGCDDEAPMKAFSELQWSYVMAAGTRLADEEPEKHERSLFLIALLYSCYLRVSEVSARPGFSPVMGQFRRDSKTGVWGFYVPMSKGGKSRTVAVSDALLKALKRYRRYLNLPELPAPKEVVPLFCRHRAAQRGRDTGELNANLGQRQIRDLVDDVIRIASLDAMSDGFVDDAREMEGMTVHSLRHTGISHDINLNGRPLSHVQADAGHDSIDTTSHYLHTSQVERHQSARAKPLDHLEHAADQ
ncbi:tyrosine-type recombinase/integrase [Ferrimonas balearica]|uniref:tyrosine-type recombinase/integrase n=1 Tax=Ferrimonas balearica TaxID=44012 RepID=UPI001C9A1474|nr:site-specific integrase [Ferrimonas balearica]MBY5920430.1 site-specific integrase [Ferrimonas balearica]MBY5996885.1 site-specific integrase [Ferrimonas balearica]